MSRSLDSLLHGVARIASGDTWFELKRYRGIWYAQIGNGAIILDEGEAKTATEAIKIMLAARKSRRAG